MPIGRVPRLLAPLLAAALGVAVVPALALPACPVAVETCCRFDAGSARQIGALELGFQVWPLSLVDAVDEAARLAPRVVRFSVGPYWRTRPPLPVDADYATVRDYVRRALSEHGSQWRKAAGAHAEIERRSGKMEQMMIIWEPPPSDADGPGLTTDAGRTARPEATVLNARFYLALVEGARRLGFRIDSLEIANEPNGTWNMRIPPAVYLDLLVTLRREAAIQGVALPRIAGPGLSFLGAMDEYFADRALARRIIGQLDIVSVHAWDDRRGRDIIEEARRVRALLDGLGWTAPIMVSEFAPTYPRAADREEKRGPDQRGGPDELVSDLPRYGPSTTQLALGLAAAGFNPLVYWEFMDPPWGKVSYGLLRSDGTPRPAYDAWRQLARVATGTRIDRVTPNLGPAAAFGLFGPDGLDGLSLTNASDQPVGLRLDPGLPTPGAHLAACGANRGSGFVLPPAGAVVAPAGR